jgi:RNA polymerase sigma-70 factor (ECF subfamily)
MNPIPDESELMRRAMRDPAQFAPLYERYFDRVYAYCRRRTDSAQEAEDLCSQVFARALGGLAGYRGGNVAAWLFQIAHNTVAKHYRARRPVASLEDIAGGADSSDFGTMEDEETRTELTRMIAELPQEQRELLSLTLDGGLNSQQVGAVLGKSAVAVRVQLHRTIERLRQQFSQMSKESNR